MRKRKRIIWSAIIAVGFLIISYCITNLHIPISGEKAVLYKFEMYRNYLFPRICSVPDSLLFINVAYDKEFVEATDEYGLPVGQTQITDRQKLLKLLQELKRRNDYKYILMDIFFDEEMYTPTDSALFATICSMPRIVIPRHKDGQLANKALYEKAGMADYTTTYKESGFVKYPYQTDSVASMPLKMYEDITGRTIKRHWFLYTDGWKVVRKSVILAFDVNVNTPYNEEGEKNWYNLGADLLGNDEEKGLLYELPELTKGKYIAIGAMTEDDMHSTYLGKMPGLVINMDAFLALMNGHHVVSWLLTLIMYVAFFILTYLTLTQQNLKEVAQNISTKKHQRHLILLSALCTWIGYSMFLTILCISTYLLLGEIYDIFITSTLFYFLHLAVKHKDKPKEIIKIWKKRKK